MRHRHLPSMAAAQSPHESCNPGLCEQLAPIVGSVSPCYALLRKDYRSDILRGSGIRVFCCHLPASRIWGHPHNSIDPPETVAAHGECGAKTRDRTMETHNAVERPHVGYPFTDKVYQQYSMDSPGLLLHHGAVLCRHQRQLV